MLIMVPDVHYDGIDGEKQNSSMFHLALENTTCLRVKSAFGVYYEFWESRECYPYDETRPNFSDRR
jgi:hypothetical protein